MRQQPLPLPPRMRAPTDREDGAARPPPERRQQQLGQGRRPFRAAEGDEAPVPARTRPPDPEPQPRPRPRPATTHAAEARAALLGDVARPQATNHAAEARAALLADVARPPAQPEGAPVSHAAREAPVAAAVARPPGQLHGTPERRAAPEPPSATAPRPPVQPNGVPEGRAARDAAKPPEQPYVVPVAAHESPAPALARPPEPRPGPHYAPDGRAAPPVATADSSSPWPYPYYYEPSPRPTRRRASPLASCLLAAVFLLLAGGGAAAALFLLFRPRPPDIAVSAVRLPSFAAGNGTVAFTFEQLATVRNPNRAPLAHFDSSLRVAYGGGEIGAIYIPAGLIDSGGTKHLTASFAVQAFPAATPQPVEIAAQQPAAAAAVMEVDSLLVVKGRVKMLRVLTHRVQASKVCRVGVSPADGRVLGFRC